MDSDAFLNRLRGNKARAYQVYQVFLGEYSDIARQIKKSVNQGDYSTVKRQLHGLKGAASNLVIPALFQCAEELEHFINKQEMQQINEKIEWLAVLMDNTSHQIRSVLLESDRASETTSS
ncbi:Hpt domain-containing protein [Paenibacillaceae bacterium]|nr:Hpt domain-containing protein [Paenibacillaceae bacterium]